MFCHNYKQIIEYIENKKGKENMSKETKKVNAVIELLLSDMKPEDITHVVINKMSLYSKRQLINEILNKEGVPVGVSDKLELDKDKWDNATWG